MKLYHVRQVRGQIAKTDPMSVLRQKCFSRDRQCRRLSMSGRQGGAGNCSLSGKQMVNSLGLAMGFQTTTSTVNAPHGTTVYPKSQ